MRIGSVEWALMRKAAKPAAKLHTVIGADAQGPVRFVVQGAKDALAAELYAKMKNATLVVSRVVEGRDVPA